MFSGKISQHGETAAETLRAGSAAGNHANVETDFRSSLEDVEVIINKLGGMFETTSDLLAAVQLGLTNDGQLRLLMNQFPRNEAAPARK